MSAVSQTSRAILVSKPEPMVTEATENIQVVVDDRERRSGIVEELEKAAGVAVKIERLALGDYCVDGAVLIERKTAGWFRGEMKESSSSSSFGHSSRTLKVKLET